MEWPRIVESVLSTSPVAGLLGYITWRLWTKLEQREAELRAKDAEIAELNEARIDDLRQILKPKP